MRPSGWHHTDETKAKISASHMGIGKGKKVSQETRVKESASQKGRKASPETCAKISASHMGNKYSAGHISSLEWRAMTSIRMKGHLVSLETRAKISVVEWKGGKGASNAKRRLLGFNPLNSPFPGCEGHHINTDDVIYTLKSVHRSVSHNIWTGRNMDKINALVYEWLAKERSSDRNNG